MNNNNKIRIIVLGCGPAGVVSAIGLAKLGYQVSVIGEVRRHQVIEGISERVFLALEHCGLTHAMQQVSKATPRRVNWNGQENSANTERLIRRVEFDHALIEDLIAADIDFYRDHIKSVNKHVDGWLIRCRTGSQYHADFIVEARGRSAPFANDTFIRGVKTLSICQNWQSDDPAFKQANAQAISIEDGWLWVANSGNGNIFTQISISAKSKYIPRKANISAFIKNQLQNHASTAPLAKSITPKGEAIARGCSPILVKKTIDEGMLRVGDAAMAADPLSGNGIFQSLSSALVAPAVINTLLQKPDKQSIAKQFYQQRLEHLFYRFARIGRDFYQMESRWHGHDFWYERSQWPDQQLAHQAQDRILGTANRPVVNGSFIEQKGVVITSEQPLGIWKIDGKDATEVLAKQLKKLSRAN